MSFKIHKSCPVSEISEGKHQKKNSHKMFNICKYTKAF